MPHVERVEPKGFLPLAFGTSRPGFSYFHGPIKRDIACELSHTSSEKITISYYVISPQVSLRPGLISLGGLVDPVAYFLRLQPVQTAWVWPGFSAVKENSRPQLHRRFVQECGHLAALAQ